MLYGWLNRGMAVDIELPETQAVFSARVIKMHSNQAVLVVSVSNDSFERFRVTPGTKAIVRRMDDKGRYESVGDIVDLKGSQLKIKLAASVSAQRRMNYRSRVELLAEYAVGSTSRGFKPVRVVDISHGGACLQGAAHLAMGDVIILRIQLPLGAIESLARVTWYDDRQGFGILRSMLGVNFVGISEGDQQRLEEYINSLPLRDSRAEGQG